MFAVKNTLVSDDILDRKFICDLNACKGACCVEGDAGAPLEEGEIKIMAEIIEHVKPNMSADGLLELEKQGLFVTDYDGDFVTPLVNGNKHCIYTIFENGIAQCSIEKTYNEGKIAFKKPLSCHLYPIRTSSVNGYEVLNYNEWGICRPACALGERHKVAVHKFLQEPLIRKYGEEWYKELEDIEKARTTL
jgi:hypothetical protein